jgi:hypothetical protein
MHYRCLVFIRCSGRYPLSWAVCPLLVLVRRVRSPRRLALPARPLARSRHALSASRLLPVEAVLASDWAGFPSVACWLFLPLSSPVFFVSYVRVPPPGLARAP